MYVIFLIVGQLNNAVGTLYNPSIHNLYPYNFLATITSRRP